MNAYTKNKSCQSNSNVSPEGTLFFFWMLLLMRTEGLKPITHTLRVLIYSTVVLSGSPICKICRGWDPRSTSKGQHAIFLFAKSVYFLLNLHNAPRPFGLRTALKKEKKKEWKGKDTIIKNPSNYIWALKMLKWKIIYTSTSASFPQEKCICRARWTPCGKYRRELHGTALYVPQGLVNKGI